MPTASGAVPSWLIASTLVALAGCTSTAGGGPDAASDGADAAADSQPADDLADALGDDAPAADDADPGGMGLDDVIPDDAGDLGGDDDGGVADGGDGGACAAPGDGGAVDAGAAACRGATQQLRFDVYWRTSDCPATGAAACFDEGLLRALDDGPCGANHSDHGHFMASTFPWDTDAIRAAGNEPAFFDIRLNACASDLVAGCHNGVDTPECCAGATWRDKGLTKGAEIYANAVARYGRACERVPRYVVLNEVNSGYNCRADYRAYVRGVVDDLTDHGMVPVVLWTHGPTYAGCGTVAPGLAGELQYIAQRAYIAGEYFLDSGTMLAHGTGANPGRSPAAIAWAAAAYHNVYDAWTRVIPSRRLFLNEIYSESTSATNWGRSGVADADWDDVLAGRAAAISQVDFAGVVSFAWYADPIGASYAERVHDIGAYTNHAMNLDTAP